MRELEILRNKLGIFFQTYSPNSFFLNVIYADASICASEHIYHEGQWQDVLSLKVQGSTCGEKINQKVAEN